MTNSYSGHDAPSRSRYAGAVNFLMPDGAHLVARCEARYTRERWQGMIDLGDFPRPLERGDVCHLSAVPLGELRIVIIDQLGSRRYQFVALITPDPLESL